MDFRYDEKQQMVRDTARRLGQRWADQMGAIRERTLREGAIPDEFWRAFADAGLTGKEGAFPRSRGAARRGTGPGSLADLAPSSPSSRSGGWSR